MPSVLRKGVAKAAAFLMVVCLAGAAGGASAQDSPKVTLSYLNPLFTNGADPWAIKQGNRYYYTHTTGTNITIWSAESLTGLGKERGKIVWAPPAGRPYSSDIWAPEIHFLNGRWYIYFAAGTPDNGAYRNQRMWVLESVTEDAQGEYRLLGKVASPDDNWAIDGTILSYENELYFVWSGEPAESGQQDICIAKMSDPATVSSEKTVISRPELEWEKRGGRPHINEGPTALVRDGKVYIVYSGSGSWSDYYCLGLLTFTGGDILNAASWEKTPQPVFETGNGIFAPGHAAFVQSADGSEDWIVYHAARKEGAGWDRLVRIQPFTWENGVPVFGTPEAGIIALPAGEGEARAPLQNGVYRMENRTGSVAVAGGENGIAALPISEADNQLWEVSENAKGEVLLRLKETNTFLALQNEELFLTESREEGIWRLLLNGEENLELYSESAAKSVGTGGDLAGTQGGKEMALKNPGVRDAGWRFVLVEAPPAPTAAPVPTQKEGAKPGEWLPYAGAALLAVAGAGTALFLLKRKKQK